MTQREIADFLGIDTKTLYNWRKHKPELYKKILQGFVFDSLIETHRQNLMTLENLSTLESMEKALKSTTF